MADLVRNQHLRLAVDGACSGNPGGTIEWRGVWIDTGEQAFRSKAYAPGTNNIAEFLAIVHGLAFLKKNGITGCTVYSDSRIAINWIRQMVCKTKYMPADDTELAGVIFRALRWLRFNPDECKRVAKWDTRRLGEIPADFGRKGNRANAI